MNLLKLWVVLILGAAQLTTGRSVTGTVRLPGGGPAAGVRVMAMVVPGPGRAVGGTSVLASLTQTDTEGHYRLEDIPPGAYFIAAGLVDAPTFYPGTLLQNEARAVMITKDGSGPSAIDFALRPLPGNRRADSSSAGPCCNLSGLVLIDDGSPLPPIPLKVLETSRNLSVPVVDGFFRLSLQRGTTAQLAVEGLPPGYDLKSVVYGGMNSGSNVFIDGRSPQSLLLMISVKPGSSLPSVTIRGKAVNLARELNVAAGSSLVLTPTSSSGTTVVAAMQPDYSFEFSSIPLGSYRAGIRGTAGKVWTAPDVVVIAKAVSDLKIDFGNNPFPELAGAGLEPPLFADDKERTITGVATQRLTPIRASSRTGYFRMDVKDERTGVVTPWAVYIPNAALVPNIAPGESYTVTGATAVDGTKRLSAKPF